MTRTRNMSDLLDSSGDVKSGALPATIDGRDVSADGTKLDGIEASADVTDTANVTSAGALMTTGGTLSGDVTFADTHELRVGTDNDIALYHSSAAGNRLDLATAPLQMRQLGTNSVVQFHNNGSNHNQILQFYKSGSAHGNISTDTGKLIIDADGELELRDGGSAKLNTTSTGIDVTGVITTDGMTTSADINFGDNDKAIFGAGNDLQIYHDGNNSVISDQGTGNLKLLANNFSMLDATNSELMMVATPDGSVDLYHNNVKKFETTSDGVTVTGLTVETASGNATGEIIAGGGTSILNLGDASDRDAGAIKYANASDSLQFFANGSERVRVNSSGFVGIGETAPVTPLTIATTNKLGSTFTGNTNGEGLTVTQTNYTSGNYISLVEAAYDDAVDNSPNVRIGAMFDGGGSHLAFGTSNNYGSGITNTAMFIDSVGKVGIGSLSPTKKVSANIGLNDTDGFALEYSGDAKAGLLVNPAAGEVRMGAINSSGTYFTTLYANNSEAMRINASGHVTKPNQVAFSVTPSHNGYIATNPIPFDTVILNTGNHFNTTNYTFTAPISGRYFIHMHLGIVRINASNGSGYPRLRVNGANTLYSYLALPAATAYANGNITAVLNLSANDTLQVTFSGNNADYYGGANECVLSGYLLG